MLGLLNAYMGTRLINHWGWAGQHKAAIWSVMALFFLLQLVGPFGDRLFMPKLRENGFAGLAFALDWLSYVSLGILSCFSMYGAAADVISIGWKTAISGADSVNFDRRALLTLTGATALTTVVGIKQAAAGPRVQEVTIPLKNLPPAFDGFKIVQISDLHVGPIIRRDYVQNVVNIAKELKGDAVALTGDFIDGWVPELANDLAPLSELQAPHGLFYVTGNHEYYWGAPAWVEHFKGMGIRVLANEHEVIQRDGASLIMAGVNDYSTLGMGPELAINPRKALEGAPEGLVKILLAHQPVSYGLAHEAGFDLQLSGHTHAGQYFPFNILVQLMQRYYKGLNRHENMWVYVNRGTGYWGPPLRAGVPSEITLITLRADA